MLLTLNMMIIIFLSSCILFTFNHKNILLTLISMEFMMINTLYLMYMILNLLKINMFFIFFFLTLSICEGILGLSILVYMIRNTGNDYLTSLNLLKW